MSYRLRHRSEEHLFGTESVWRDGSKVDVSNPERTLVDVLDDPAFGAGIRHIADCLAVYFEGSPSRERLIDYADRLGNRTVFKRLVGRVASPRLRRASTMTLSVDEILEELRLSRGYFPQEAVEAAVERREEMVPELLRILDEAVAGPDALLEERGAMGHIYALYLLAQFRETAAFPRILRLFRLPDDVGVESTGDIVTESLDRLLATLNGGNVASIQRLVEDTQVNEWVRGAALGWCAPSRSEPGTMDS